MLAGLSPSRLSLTNTVLACVVAGGLGVLVAPLIALDAQTLAFQVVPALGAALLAGFTSFFIACFAGLAIGVIQSLLIYWSTQSWFPTDKGGAPLRGLPELFVFLVIVLALFLRGASLPGRGELVEKRLPAVPRPGAAAPVGRDRRGRRRRRADRVPVRLPAGADQLAARRRHLPLARRHHRLRRPDLGRAARARRRRGLHDVAPHDRRRRHLGEFPISLLIGAATATVVGLLIAVSALRVRGVSLVVVTLAAAVALEQFGFVNARWGGGATGSPVNQPELGGLDLSPHASFSGLDDKIPSPMFGFLVLAAVDPPRPARRQRAALEPGAADARRALERARRGGGRDQRPQHEARRLRHRVVRRRHGRRALRVQLRLGQLQPLRGPRGARR